MNGLYLSQLSLEGLDHLNKMPIAKIQEKFRFFSVLFLHSIFNIEKNCVLTIFKAINYKTINSECLVPQDMREGRYGFLATYLIHEMCSRFEHCHWGESQQRCLSIQE